MQLEDFLENKKVLMIPVYSSRSYDTGKYDLATDGNVSKYATKIINANVKLVDIAYPFNSVNSNYISEITRKYMKGKNVFWIPLDYGANAHETRNMGEYFLEFIKLLGGTDKYDVIITEVDTLAYLVATNDYEFCNKDKFIYWAGTHNADGTPWYEDGHQKLNQTIAENITTACLFEGQVNFYGGKTFYDEYTYNSKLYDKQIIFFPFRLTDKSYKLDLFKEAIKKLLEIGIDNFVVLYTDPNESHLLDDVNPDIYIKTSSNKFAYQAILKGKPIIPYFDDLSKNSHTNIFEFKYYGCDIITDEVNFYEILKNKLEGKNDEQL